MSRKDDDGRPDENADEARRREEEMRRNMDFIIRHQAQFANDLQSLGEAQARNEERWARADERWARTEEGIRSLLTIAEIHEREITALRETTKDLSETTRATDERLNALINLVERDISERRNGKKD